MAKQTHTVATDALATLGTIIDETAGRDAIHLAVEPVVAKRRLHPGQDVDAQGDVFGPMVGIVDPFLKNVVAPGERFWLVVYPRQITSLRHVWEHPAFPVAADPNHIVMERGNPMDSKEWLHNWLRDTSVDYDEFIAAVSGEGPRHITVGPEDFHVSGHNASGEIPAEAWEHVANVLGYMPKLRPQYFSCSC